MKANNAERVTQRIKEALEQGVRPWARPWELGVSPAPQMSLQRRSTGQAYRGVNQIALWVAAQACGYTSPYWFTFNQAKALGGNVKKGAKGEIVVYYTMLKKEQEREGKREEVSIPLLKGYVVFNYDQCEGLPERFAAPVAQAPVEPGEFDVLFAKVGARVLSGGDRAFYAPGPDYIQMGIIYLTPR